MEVTKEQIASDIVRNLSVALGELYKASVDSYSDNGVGLRVGIEKKLQKWTEEL